MKDLLPAFEQVLGEAGYRGGGGGMVVYKFVCKNEKRTVTTDEWLESDVLFGMWICLDAVPRPGANHSLHNLSKRSKK